MMSFGYTLLASFLISSFVMWMTWIYAKKINNYSIVDAVWALSFVLVTAFYALLGNGFAPRKLLILACVGIWSLRLGIFLWIRIRGHHPKEDGRYVELREKYKPHVERGFFWFFEYQAWSVVFLTIPFLLICENDTPTIQPIEWVGIAFWAISLLGEGTADRQAKIFKSDPKNAKRVCNVGLWKYSRHPNYFFESCVWWSYFLIALGSANGVFTIYCPLIMLFLLLKVTGVPLSEAQSLKSRGDAYREYQKRTSAFVPWFPKALVIAVMGSAVTLLFSAGQVSIAATIVPATQVSPSSTGVQPDLIAKIYAVGKTSEPPLFVQKTHYDIDSEGNTHSHTNIVDANGKSVLTEEAIYQKTKLISQSVNKLQVGEHYETKIKDDHVIFTESDTIDGKLQKPKESSEGFFDDFSSGPTAEAYLEAHWDELLKGKTVPSKFAVNEVRETIGFDFKMKGRKKVGDVDAVWISMSPSSLFISLVADAFDLYLDPKTKRYVKFVGRTPLKTSVNGKLKPFDGEILYSY